LQLLTNIVIICLQELGTYCGYSTILLAAHLKDPSAKVYTIDICEENVAIARAMIAHAGLTDRVVHIVKPLDQAVQVCAHLIVIVIGMHEAVTSAVSWAADRHGGGHVKPLDQAVEVRGICHYLSVVNFTSGVA
jgi:protein-L-isoaspartate O-methyltransferase